jgi:hypothetical protein
MGLTIHYRLQSAAEIPSEARDLVAGLRRRALDLPFAHLSDVLELTGPACDYERYPADDRHCWLLIQAGQSVAAPGHCGPRCRVTPTRVIAFSAWPGKGCETANFGLLCDRPHNSPSVAQSVMWPSPFLRRYFSVSLVFCAT